MFILSFYTENEYVLNKFRTRGGKLNLHSLYAHTKAILYIYDRLIKEGLENYSMFHIILTEVAESHSSMIHDGNDVLMVIYS